MESKLFVGVISVFVAIVVLAGALMPVINDAASGETTIHITNEDSSTLKLQKITSNFSLDLSVTTDGDSNIVVSNGNDSIVADPNESMYILATDSAAIYYDQGDTVFIWTDENGTSDRLLTNPFTAVIADGKLTVDDGTSTDAPLPNSYMFAPSSTGQYGSFTAADLNLVPDDPVIAAGSFAGVYCYNQYSTIGNALQEYVTISDDVLTEVIWAAAADAVDQQSIEPFDPSQIDFNPIDFNPINPGENIIMAVPTPTYTDGDWGYDLDGSDAIIVSYSGAGGNDITIPATVGGYDVKAVGKGSNNQIFNSSTTINNLIISEGITTINDHVFQGPNNIKGTLTLPSTLTSIDASAFYGCSQLTSIILPENLTTIGKNAFYGCWGLDGMLVLPENLTSIGSSAFNNCSALDSLVVLTSAIPGTSAFAGTGGIKEILNLSSNTWTTTSYGLSADEVRDSVDAVLYLAPADVPIKTGGPNVYAPLLDAIPMIIIMSILMMIVGYTMIRRSY